MKTKLAAALAAVLVCASAAASEVRLSLSSADEYHYIQIPSNMVASIEGRGMVSNETTGHVPLRYEDAAFVKEAIAERFAFNSELSSGVGGTNYFSSSSYGYTPEEIDSFNFGIPLNYGIWTPSDFYAKPEARAFTNDVVKYIPYDSRGNFDINGSNIWSTVFSASCPSMFFVNEDIPPSVAAITNGSPLRFSAIKECYDFVGKLTRPCFDTARISSLDGKKREESSTARILTNLISYYDGYKGAWVYFPKNESTNTTDTTTATDCRPYYRIKYSATRKKSVGRYDGKVVTGVVPSYMTETHYGMSAPNSFPIIDLRPAAMPLGSRKAESVSLFLVGCLAETIESTGMTTWTKYNYFIARVDAVLVEPKDPYAIVVKEDTGKQFTLELLNKVATFFYGKGGLPYKSADELLKDVPQPKNPTGADDKHVDTENTYWRTYELSVYTAYILYDGMKFNARVLEDGE